VWLDAACANDNMKRSNAFSPAKDGQRTPHVCVISILRSSVSNRGTSEYNKLELAVPGNNELFDNF
jgi:hypothetical protein